MLAPLLRLQCGVNSYEWGKEGSNSCAARYAAATAPTDFSIKADQPYAELWMGTHPSNPSYDISTGRTLLQLIQNNEGLLSPSLVAQYGRELPFLFKILSIKKALSIQAHPNKNLAKRLHVQDPVNYPDDNHKPEMAIAITPFEALCGFRPLKEIACFLETVPALRALVGEDEALEFQSTLTKYSKDTSVEAKVAGQKALHKIFGKLMESCPSTIESASKILVDAARNEGDAFAGHGVTSTSGTVLSDLIIRLYGQYGADHGLFVLFFANFATLKPGEALYLQADDIHAYISGDIVECMATSDNVVRAGFTSRFKDVSTLVEMLTYHSAPIEDQKLQAAEYRDAALNHAARSSGSFVTVYNPPIEEFAVARCVLKGIGAMAKFAPLASPSILICTRGSGSIKVGLTRMDMKEGFVFFVGSEVECSLETEVVDSEFEVYKAFCDVDNRRNCS